MLCIFDGGITFHLSAEPSRLSSTPFSPTQSNAADTLGLPTPASSSAATSSLGSSTVPPLSVFSVFGISGNALPASYDPIAAAAAASASATPGVGSGVSNPLAALILPAPPPPPTAPDSAGMPPLPPGAPPFLPYAQFLPPKMASALLQIHARLAASYLYWPSTGEGGGADWMAPVPPPPPESAACMLPSLSTGVCGQGWERGTAQSDEQRS